MKRRTVLKCLGSAAMAGLVGWPSWGRAAQGAEPRLIEKQASGAEIWQVTHEPFQQSNIYTEVVYCSGDSRHFVYERTNPKLKDNTTEFVVVEVGSWKQTVLDTAAGLRGCAISVQGVFYYLKQNGAALDLMRADLARGRPEKVHTLRSRPRSLGTVSVDGRYYATGKVMDEQYKAFGILLVDLKTGEEKVIDQDPFILNPHPQFEPGQGRQLLIQHNRGGVINPDGKLKQLVGPEGATLYLLSVPEGKRTGLQIGKPHTTACTGHEAWIGDTQEVLTTVAASGDFAPEKGNMLGIRAGAKARVVARGYRFNHVGVSRCGRFFIGDDWRGSCQLVVGSFKTGKTVVVCESKTSMSRAQNTHPHAYLTPDLKWVIFNSDRSGHPHIHAASVPERMIKGLDEA